MTEPHAGLARPRSPWRRWQLVAIVFVLLAPRCSEPGRDADTTVEAGPDLLHEPDVCVPDCTGRQCGEDGCGGDCGACPDNGHCSAGLCQPCEPQCAGRQCGDDGCGGECGLCPAAMICRSWTCEACEPACAGKECGPDGCGNFCGVCDPDEVCAPEGVCSRCEPDCAFKDCGDDGCGGSCGSCSGSRACEDGLCVSCAPVCAGRQCGDDGCGGVCGDCSGLPCVDGHCVTIPYCVDGECLVPAGRFMMGCNATFDTACDDDELPYHAVTLDAYRIDQFEVTVADYRRCVDATPQPCTLPRPAEGCNWGVAGRDSFPINCIDRSQAEAFCLRMGKRLCTEAQWEKAARGGCEFFGDCERDSRTFPWGNEPAECSLAVFDDGQGPGCGANRTWAVGTRPAGDSPYGVSDLAGNVWEWVADGYRSNAYQGCVENCVNPQQPAGGSVVVLRGGCFQWGAEFLRASDRSPDYPEHADASVGIRCCRPAEVDE